MTDLDRCRVEQAECSAYLRSGQPDQRGAWAGLTDWLTEEVIILSEMEGAA